ncbi:MAG: FAD-dependent oxidoreductase, partial [Planctomycetaceae bacterium]|nr:FAD-dependent oxidoreductase [Planctomycetaceae bacterium]
MTKLHNEQVNHKRKCNEKDYCDVLIVGGGPAGSACARQLVRAGYDVVILDRAEFPRSKTCGGWITPQIVEELEISLEEYGSQYELQPIEGFRTGLVGDDSTVDTCYERTVSYGIRRIEFDNYLLQRSGARLHLGESVDSFERQAEGWLINGRYRATLLIGAGGNFCPVARHFNQESKDPEHIVRAQETEFLMSCEQAEKCRVQSNRPELYFFPDLQGYAWCFRKHDYLNV